jgi:hypothetical protein
MDDALFSVAMPVWDGDLARNGIFFGYTRRA